MDDRLWLDIAMHNFIAEALRTDFSDAVDVTELWQAYCRLVAFTVVATQRGTALRSPEADLAFANLLKDTAQTPELCAKAHFWRKAVLEAAEEIVARNTQARRSDDPRTCDPGGGMRSPHEIDDDEQF